MKKSLEDQEVQKIKKLIENMKTSSEGKTVEELKSILSNDANNHDLRFELAEKYFSQKSSC